MKTNEGGAAFGAIGKERSKLLAVIAVAAVMLACVVVLMPVDAEDSTVDIEYTSISPSDFLALDTDSDGVITLEGDYRITGVTVLTGDLKLITNGHSLITSGDMFRIGADGIDVEIDATAGGNLTAGASGRSSIIWGNYYEANVTVNGGVYTSDDPFTLCGNNKVDGLTTFSIEDATINGNTSGIWLSYGTIGTATITGCTVSATHPMYIATVQSATISDCTIDGTSFGIEIKAGDVDINNCIIHNEKFLADDSVGMSQTGGSMAPITINNGYCNSAQITYVDVTISNITVTCDAEGYTPVVVTSYYESESAKNDSDISVTWEGASNSDVTFCPTQSAATMSVNGFVAVDTPERLAAAVENGSNVVLAADITASMTVDAGQNIIMDLNGFTLNGGTTKSTPAIYNSGTLTIIDSSKDQSGVVQRSDVNAGSYYVIDNHGVLTIQGGTVTNNSGYPDQWQGSSLIRNIGTDADNNAVLNIMGGHIYQKNFIAMKNDDFGILNVSGGLIEAGEAIGGNAGASAIQNWNFANITGGTVNGPVMTCVWENNPDDTVYGDSRTIIGGTAEINGALEASYDTTFPSNTSKAYIEIKDGAIVEVSSVYISRGVVEGNFELISGGSIRMNEGGTIASTVTGPDGNTLTLDGFTANTSVIITAGSFVIDGSWVGEMTVSGDDIVITGSLSDEAHITIKPQADGTPTNVTWRDFADNGATIEYLDNEGNDAKPSEVANQIYENATIGGVTIDTVYPDGGYIYDGEAQPLPTITVSVTDGQVSTSGFLQAAGDGASGSFVAEDGLSYYWATSIEDATIWHGGMTVSAAIDAGAYTVKYGYAVDGAVHVTECSWIIERAILTITVDAEDVYDGEEMPYYIATDNVTGLGTGDSITGGTIITTGSDVGDYTAEAVDWILEGLSTSNGIANYDIVYGSISLKITKAPLTITVDAEDVYDGEDFEYSIIEGNVDGLIGDETLTGTLTTTGSDADDYTYFNDEIIPDISISSDVDNYEITYNVTLTITPKELTITDATIGDKTYDGTTDATVTDVTFGGLIAGESISGADYTATATFDDFNAGKDKIIWLTVIVDEGSLVLQNYSLPDEATVLEGYTISKREITVTGGTVPDKTYDGTRSGTVTAVTFGGLIEADSLIIDEDFTATAEYPWGPDAGTEANNYLKMATITVTLNENLNYIFAGDSLTAVSPEVSSHILPIEITEDMVDVSYAPSGDGIQVSITVSSNSMSPSGLTVTHTPAEGADSTDNPFVVEESASYTITLSTTDGNWSVPDGFQMVIDVELNTVNYYTKSTIEGEYELEQTDVGSSVRTPNATNIPDGYILAGWSTTENGAKVYGVDVNIDVPASGLDLYAVYEVDDGTVVEPGTGSLSDIIVNAIHYPYEGGYDYTGIFNIVNGNVVVTYDSAMGEAIQELIQDYLQSGTIPSEVPEELVPMMNDLARFLGALHYYAPSVVDSITYGGTIYTWNAGEPNTASNWYNGSTSLVSAIVAAALTSDGSMELILTDGTYQYAFTYGVQFEDAPAPEVQYHDVTIEGEGVAIYIDGLRYFPGTYSMAEGEHTIGVEVLSGYTGTPVISNVTDGKFTVSGEMTIAISGVTAVVDPDPEKELPGIEFDMPVFTAGQDDAFRVTFIANDFVGETVTVKAKFSGDSSDITSIRYWNVNNNSWDTMVAEADGYYVYGGSGFPLSDATSAFRATFANAGVYTLTVYISIGGAEITSATETFIVEEPAVVSEYTVSFFIDENVGVTIDLMTVASGVGINLPVVSVEGYTFSGWMIQGGNSSIIYNGYYVPNSNVVFEAVISEDDTSFEPVYYNVILGSTTYSKLADSPVGLPSMIDGREITGWSTTSGTYTGVYYVNPADAVEGTITLTPIYADEEGTYDIRVKLTGAGASESSYGTPVRDGNNFYLTVYTPIGYQIGDFTAKIGETVLGMSPVTSIDRHTVTFLIGVTSNGDVEVDISIEPNNVSDNITVSMEAAMDSSENEGVYIELDSNSDVAYLPVDATLTITYYYSYVDDSDSSLHIGVRSTDAITVENSGESISQALFIDLGLGSNYENPADADQFAEGNAYWIVAEYRYGESTVISNTVSPAYVES